MSGEANQRTALVIYTSRFILVYNRRLQDIAVLMYKVKKGLVPDDVSSLFVRKVSTNMPRNSDFVIPGFNTTHYHKHTIRYLGPFVMAQTQQGYKRCLNSNYFPKQNQKTLLIRLCY